MTVGDVLAQSFALYRRFFARFVGVSAVVFLVTDVVGAAAARTSPGGSRAALIVLTALLAAIGYLWLQAALTAAVDDVRDGRIDRTIAELYGETARALPSLFVVGVALGVGAVALFLLLAFALGIIGVVIAFVVIVWLLSRLVLSVPIVVLQQAGPIDGLGRSWRLVRGHAGTAFLVLFVTSIAAGIVSGVLSAVLRAALPTFLGNWLGPAIGSTVTAPLVALAVTVMYFELRDATAQPDLPPAAAYREE